jgi:hypothetical protein
MIAFYGKARRTHRWFAVIERIACDFDHLRPLGEAALAEEGVPPSAFEWVAWSGSGMLSRL